jgi:hypothetical protein
MAFDCSASFKNLRQSGFAGVIAAIAVLTSNSLLLLTFPQTL